MRKHIALFIVLSVLMADSLWADVKQRDIEFEFSKQVEICNEQDEFTLRVNIGEVDIEDGYVGFEISFTYDTNQVMVYPLPIVAGTISSRLNYNANYFIGTAFPIEGTSLKRIRAEVSHVGKPVSGPDGNETLVMFKGRYKGGDTCGLFDYVQFDNIYFYRYLDYDCIEDQQVEYKYSPGEIVAGSTFGKYARIVTDFDSITLDSAKLISNTVSMVKNEQMTDALITVTSTNSTNFDYQIVESDDDNLLISSIDYETIDGNKIAKVYATLADEVNQFECFDIQYQLTNTLTDSCSFNITIEDLDECKCIADYTSEEKKIKNVIPEIVGINELEDESIIYTSNEIIISNDNKFVKAYLYDINGRFIEALSPNNNKIILVKANYLNGSYTLVCESGAGSKLSKKIIINK